MEINKLYYKNSKFHFLIIKQTFYFIIFLALYYFLLFAVYFIYIDGDRYYNDFSDSSLRLHADALFYVEVAKSSSFMNLKDLLSFDANYLGPFLILILLGKNNFLVMIFNIVLLNYSIFCLKSVQPKLNLLKFNIWMYANPILFFSLLTINKEILSISSFSFLFCFHYSSKIRYLIIALILSLFARWQFLVINLFYLFSIYYSIINRRVIVIISITIFSVILGYVPEFTDYLLDAGLMGKEIQLKYGLSTLINDLQKNYLYCLALPLRFLIQMVFPSMAILTNLLNPDTNWISEFYNVIVIPYSCLVSTIFFFIYFIKNKLFSLDKDICYFSLLILIFIGFTPFSSYRYFYPIYTLLVMDFSIKKLNNN